MGAEGFRLSEDHIFFLGEQIGQVAVRIEVCLLVRPAKVYVLRAKRADSGTRRI